MSVTAIDPAGGARLSGDRTPSVRVRLITPAGLAMVPGLPRKTPTPDEPVGLLTGLRNASLLRPSIIFAATTIAAGVVVTFPRLALARSSADLATVALLTQAAKSSVIRWLAGCYGDRHGQSRLLMPGLIAFALGIPALVLIASPVAVVAGMVLFGAGFGVTQNASLAMMSDRVSVSGFGAVDAHSARTRLARSTDPPLVGPPEGRDALSYGGWQVGHQ